MAVRRSARVLQVLVTALLVASAIAPAETHGLLTVTVSPPNVMLNYHLEFQENFTTLSQAGVTLDASNSTGLEMTIQNAMQRLVPEVHVDPSTFRFEATIEQQSPGSNTWKIKENLTGTVIGAESNARGIMNYDLRFLAMNVSDSLQFGGTEFNNIGRAYLVQPLNSERPGTRFYLDQALARGGPYSNSVIPGNATFRFSLLDFSWLPKISNWDHSYRPFDSSSSWTLNPIAYSNALPFNLTAGIPSPEGTLLTSFVAFMNPTLTVTAPPRSWSQASTVSVALESAVPGAMALILIAVVTLGVGTYVVERRVLRPVKKFRKKDR